MPEPLPSDELLQRVPAFLGRVRELETFDDAQVRAALDASGLEPVEAVEAVDDGGGGGPTWLELLHVGDGSPTFERRLRTAITRRLGKPTGGDKHWDAGCAAATLLCRARDPLSVTVVLEPQYSVVNLRAAAVGWLEGTEVRAWLLGAGFVDEGVEPDEAGRWPRPDRTLSGASVTTRPDGTVRVSFFMEPGSRPLGAKGGTDADRWAETLAYLVDGLGPPTRAGWWHRGSRTFQIEWMRSSARSITFAQALPGTVESPTVGTSRIPTTPDPDPVGAAAALRAVAGLRGEPVAAAVPALVRAGVVAPDGPAAQRLGGLVLLDPAGRPVELDLVDGRLAGGAVEATSDESWDAVEDAFTATFGASGSHGFDRRWAAGPMRVGFAGRSGDVGFERLRAQVAEDTGDPVRSVEQWLVWAEPFADVRLADAWQARCLGAAISGGVVPSVSAGQPVWKADDRMLWLDGVMLRAAGPGSWPAWADDLPAGGTSAPVPPELLADLVRAVDGWRAATPGTARETLAALDWTTRDPDVARQTSATSAGVRLLQPVGSSFSMFLGDGRIRHWGVDVAVVTEPDRRDEARHALEAVLEPYGDRATGGWQVGEFDVRIAGPASRRASYVRLEGTRRPGPQN